jgi:hypothetical protein
VHDIGLSVQNWYNNNDDFNNNNNNNNSRGN